MRAKTSLGVLLISLSGVPGQALTMDGEVDMSFRGTLIEPPPCTINDGNEVDVDFGTRVGINKVDGVNYRQDVNYRITCAGVGNGKWRLMLRLKGGAAGFDPAALVTNRENLGIRIYQNGTSFKPGDTLKIDPDAPPRLEAVPVKRSGATLKEGAFEALATLQADYQ